MEAVMRAIVMDRHGGPEELRLVDIPEPEPAPGQVVVEVAAAGVNFKDVYERKGLYPASLPFHPGSEGAGTVVATAGGNTADGDGGTDLRVGDRVVWSAATGSYAERAAIDASQAVPIPAGVSEETAAAVFLQGLTAHYLATSTYPVGPGDVVVVHAAAGGVGLLLTQIVKLRGGRVIGTVSSEAKASVARAAGADEVIDYSTGDFADTVRKMTDGRGADVVYDGVGKNTFDGSLASLRRRGLLALYGAASGPVPPVDLQVLNRYGSLFVTRPKLTDYTANREELLSRSAELFNWVGSGQLDVHVGGRYPLADAARAHADLEGRRTTGKLLLLPTLAPATGRDAVRTATSLI
jgi:NADPH2:quinone reductase